MSDFGSKSLRTDAEAYSAAFEAKDQLGGFIGAKCVSLSDSECLYEYEVSSNHFNPNGLLHGGALFTAMDSSQGMLIHYILGSEFEYGVTGTATIRYEKPVKIGQVLIRTFLDRRDGRKYFIRSIATQQDQIVATLDEIWIAIATV